MHTDHLAQALRERRPHVTHSYDVGIMCDIQMYCRPLMVPQCTTKKRKNVPCKDCLRKMRKGSLMSEALDYIRTKMRNERLDGLPNNRENRGDEAEVTRTGALDMQVCVPADWSDDQVKGFADRKNLCGTQHGWGIRREGDPLLQGAHERVPCASREDFVHIMLDA